jgi:hypothetical protein
MEEFIMSVSDITPSDPTDSAALHEPVERFRGSHSEIVVGLRELRRLPALADALQQARATADHTLALFEHCVVPHHIDEEQELFVAAVRSAGDAAEKARVEDLVARLVAQHRQIEQLWAEVRPTVLAVAAGKAHTTPDFTAAVAKLVDTYLEHTRLEELVFLPLADEILARNPNHLAALDVSLHIRHVPMPRVAYM